MSGAMRAGLVALVLAALAGLFWFLSGGPNAETDAARSPMPAAALPPSDLSTAATSPVSNSPGVQRDVLLAEPEAEAKSAPTDAALRLRVRVRNAAGRPVDSVPVRVDLGVLSSGRVDVRPTRSNGIATFPIPARNGVAPFDASSPVTIPVALELPTFDALRADVPAATIARGEVFDLALPPCGAIRVHLVGLDGRTASNARIGLELRPLAPDETLADAERRAGVSTSAEAGVAEFGFVPLHSVFALIPRAIGLRANFAPVRVLGPTAEGQCVETTLREDVTAACVVVRLVDATRAPVRGEQIGIGLNQKVQIGTSSGVTSTSTTETTDDAGELRLWFDAGGPDSVRRITFARRERPEATATLTIDYPLAPGVTHLGDVVLDVERNVAFAGRVVDEHDAPVAGARIDVSRITRFPGGGRASTGVEVDAHSDDAGTFEIRFASDPDAEYSVSAHKEGYLAEGAVDARFGTADLRLRLRRAGSITGSLAVDAATLELIGVRAIATEIGRREGVIDAATGAFAFESLAAGTYIVELTRRGAGRPWLRVADVDVRAGEATADPRLQGVALPAGLRRVRVIVQDSAGRPLADAIVRADEPLDVSQGISLRHHDGDGIAILARPGSSLFAGAPGFRSQAFTVVEETHTVHLLPGIPLRVRVAGDYASVHPDLQLGVSASPSGATAISYTVRGANRSTSGQTYGFDALFVSGAEIAPGEDRAQIVLPTPGRWTVGLNAIAATGGMRIATRIHGDSTQEVTVDETGGEVTLHLTAAAVSAALPKK